MYDFKISKDFHFPSPGPAVFRRVVSKNEAGFLAFLPPANEVWGKVIFLQASVILFTGGGHVCPGWCACPGGMYALRGHACLGEHACLGGHACLRGMPGRGCVCADGGVHGRGGDVHGRGVCGHGGMHGRGHVW